MFKRILAFIMCAVMVVSMVGCGDTNTLEGVADGDGTRSTNAPITLSLYLFFKQFYFTLKNSSQGIANFIPKIAYLYTITSSYFIQNDHFAQNSCF